MPTSIFEENPGPTPETLGNRDQRKKPLGSPDQRGTLLRPGPGRRLPGPGRVLYGRLVGLPGPGPILRPGSGGRAGGQGGRSDRRPPGLGPDPAVQPPAARPGPPHRGPPLRPRRRPLPSHAGQKNDLQLRLLEGGPGPGRGPGGQAGPDLPQASAGAGDAPSGHRLRLGRAGRLRRPEIRGRGGGADRLPQPGRALPRLLPGPAGGGPPPGLPQPR